MLEVPGTAPQRKALEAAATTLYCISSGRSPAASFGRTPAGYQISSGNNARLTGVQELARAPGDVAELGVPVRVLGALGDLGVALQAVALGLQQPRHRRRRAPVARWTDRLRWRRRPW